MNLNKAGQQWLYTNMFRAYQIGKLISQIKLNHNQSVHRLEKSKNNITKKHYNQCAHQLRKIRRNITKKQTKQLLLKTQQQSISTTKNTLENELIYKKKPEWSAK